MKNIDMQVIIKKAISILNICLCSAAVTACSSYDDGAATAEAGDFGYESRYAGYTFHAAFQSDDASQTIASSLVKAVNLGNKIYLNSVKMMLPELFTDNGSIRRTDNGTCTKGAGARSYNTRRKSGINADNVSFTSEVVFDSYCINNPLQPQYRDVMLRNTGELEETYGENISNVSETYKFYSDNLSVHIQNDGSSWDNVTMNGLVIKERTFQINLDNDTLSSTQLSMDMPGFETDYRFDLYSNEMPVQSRSIRFFHHSYGYVTADISFLENNETLSSGQWIKMTFQDNKTCSFTPAQIGTKDFNCGRY